MGGFYALPKSSYFSTQTTGRWLPQKNYQIEMNHKVQQSATVSLLFLLALYGSVNHEVGEVNVAFSFFCLQHTQD